MILTQINYQNESTYLEEFIEIYRKSFAEEPYFEEYTKQWIIDNVWKIHLEYGYIVVALEEGKLIGLGCCIFINSIPEQDPNYKIVKFLKQQKTPFDTDHTCYISELAVKKEYRNNEVGSIISKRMITWSRENNATHWLMRTADKNSQSKNLFLRLNGKVIPELIQDISEHAAEVNSASKKRIYICGKTDI